MIVGAGWAKGMKLKVPAGIATRPTSGKVRAAALNMLAPWIEGARFVDIFAGSGAMGIESVSRGAHSCVFVESAKPALLCLNANLEELKRRAASQSLQVPDLQVLAIDAKATVQRLKNICQPDIIFVDPPYQDGGRWIEELVQTVAEICHGDSILMLEHDTSKEVLARIESGISGWRQVKQKTYGETALTLMEWAAET